MIQQRLQKLMSSGVENELRLDYQAAAWIRLGNHYSSLIPDTDELGERDKLFKKKSMRLELNLHRGQSSSNVPSF